MEKKDIELIEKNRETNYDLDRLYEAHVKLDSEVSELESKGFLTPEEKNHVAVLKKTKLDGRDKIELILQTLR